MKQIRLALFTRYPTPGTAKTRLIPALGGEGAAALHARLTERTTAILRAAGHATEIHYSGGAPESWPRWLGSDLTYIAQAKGDLTDRLLAAIDPAPVIFFGSDTPDLAGHHVVAAISALDRADVVIGPAEDGGYYLIGIAQPYRYLFEDMRWSSEHVTPDSLARARQHNLRVALLESLADCDRPEDLARWPWLTP